MKNSGHICRVAQACAERYREIGRDLRFITQTLQQEPPRLRIAARSPDCL